MKPIPPKSLYSILSLVLFFSLCFVIPSFAVSPGEQPGAQGESFHEESEAREQALKQKANPIQVNIPQEEEKITPEEAKISFTLKQINITGATVYTPEQLEPLYKPFLNKKITYKGLLDIVKTINAKYQKAGYLTTSAHLLKQKIQDGVVEIHVLESRMGELTVDWDKYLSIAIIKEYFHTKKGEIFNINKVKRDLLRLDLGSALGIKSVISVGKVPGTTDITLKVADNFFGHIGANFDNQGTRLTGLWRQAASLRYRNVIVKMDSLYESSIFSSGTFGQFVHYSLPIGTYGTKFVIDATYFRMRVGKEYKPYNINDINEIYTPQFSWELALREDYQAYVSLGLKIKSMKEYILGNRTSDDQLRIPCFRFDFTKSDSFGGKTTFSPKFYFGTSGFLGSSSMDNPSASRADANGSFFKYYQTLNRIQRMPWDSYLSIRTNLQTTSHTLVYSEQLQLGGEDSIRGYPIGDYLADMGGSMSLDWVMPMYLIPQDWKLSSSSTPLRHIIEPVFFADVGGGCLKKVMPGELKDKFLSGVGGGFKIHCGRYASLNLEWARYTGDKPTSGSGPSTFYFAFQSAI